MTVYLLIFLIVIVVPVGTIIHELGHGIAAYFVNADRITLHIGVGKHIKTFRMKRFAIFLYRIFFIGGVSDSRREIPYNTSEKIWIALGGPAGNAIVIILFFVILNPLQNPYTKLFILFQSWLMLINLIPFKWKGKKSDGYTVVHTMRKKSRDKK